MQADTAKNVKSHSRAESPKADVLLSDYGCPVIMAKSLLELLKSDRFITVIRVVPRIVYSSLR